MANRSKSSIRGRIAAVRVPKTLRNKAKDVLANPVARELLAAALVNIAIALLRKQSAKGSAARRFIGDNGFQAGKLGSVTINQLFDTLLGSRNWWPSGSVDKSRPEERARRPRRTVVSRKSSKSRKASVRGRDEDGREVAAIH